MPAASVGQGTSTTIQSAHGSIFGNGQSIAEGGSFTSPVLSGDGLPHCNAYVLQTSAGTLAVTAEFLQTPTVWLPLNKPVVPVLNEGNIINNLLGAAFYRLTIVNTGVGAVTVNWRLTATP